MLLNVLGIGGTILSDHYLTAAVLVAAYRDQLATGPASEGGTAVKHACCCPWLGR